MTQWHSLSILRSPTLGLKAAPSPKQCIGEVTVEITKSWHAIFEIGKLIFTLYKTMARHYIGKARANNYNLYSLLLAYFKQNLYSSFFSIDKAISMLASQFKLIRKLFFFTFSLWFDFVYDIFKNQQKWDEPQQK